MTRQLVRTRSTTAPLRCATCHDDLRHDEPRWRCAGCGTALHEDCAQGLGRCVTTGCRARAVSGSADAGAKALSRADRALSAAVYVAPALAALLWPLVFVGCYLLLEATVAPVPSGAWLRVSMGALEGGLIGAVALPLVLGNGVFALRASARGLPGRHQLRALAGAIGGAVAGTAALALVLRACG